MLSAEKEEKKGLSSFQNAKRSFSRAILEKKLLGTILGREGRGKEPRAKQPRIHFLLNRRVHEREQEKKKKCPGS